MALKHMHHHGFTVSDLSRSIRYYRDVLGMELIRESERSNLPSYDHMLGFKDVRLRVGLLKDKAGNLLELFQYVNPPSTPRELKNNYVGSSHVAFEVEDIDETYARLKQHGHGAIAPPVDVIRDGRKVARVTTLGRSRRFVQAWAYAYRDGGIAAMQPRKSTGPPTARSL